MGADRHRRTGHVLLRDDLGGVAEAYRLAIVGDSRGAFNVATDPPIDGPTLAELLDTGVGEGT